MDKDKKHRLQLSDIGYHGKPIETLSKEELLKAILEFAQMVYNCSCADKRCEKIISKNKV